MESGLNLAWEYNTLINELTQGMEKAKQLHFHVCSTSRSEVQDLLLQRILSSYEKALLILKWKGSSSVGQAQIAAPTSGGPESSISVDGSPKSEDLNKKLRDHKECVALKKRKLQPTWTKQVRVNSENGLDGPSDDGYSWRKYGQKEILGAIYPRSYYRCTYRPVQNCWATKQVQRSDDNPNVFDITYKGTHTCNQSTSPVPPPPSALADQKLESKHTSQIHHQQNEALLNFKTNLRVSTETFDNNNKIPPQFSFQSTYSENHDFSIASLVGDNHLGYCPSFLSPATSGTNYFSPVNYHMRGFGGNNRNYQHSESDIAEIISAHASTNNSPIGGMEFPSDPLDLDPNFPFITSGFFT